MLAEVKSGSTSDLRGFSDYNKSTFASSTSNTNLLTESIRQRWLYQISRPGPKSYVVSAHKVEITEEDESESLDINDLDIIGNFHSEQLDYEESEIVMRSNIVTKDLEDTIHSLIKKMDTNINISVETGSGLSPYKSSVSSFDSNSNSSVAQNTVLTKLGINENSKDNKPSNLERVYKYSLTKRLEKLKMKKSSNCGCF